MIVGSGRISQTRLGIRKKSVSRPIPRISFQSFREEFPGLAQVAYGKIGVSELNPKQAIFRTTVDGLLVILSRFGIPLGHEVQISRRVIFLHSFGASIFLVSENLLALELSEGVARNTGKYTFRRVGDDKIIVAAGEVAGILPAVLIGGYIDHAAQETGPGPMCFEIVRIGSYGCIERR